MGREGKERGRERWRGGERERERKGEGREEMKGRGGKSRVNEELNCRLVRKIPALSQTTWTRIQALPPTSRGTWWLTECPRSQSPLCQVGEDRCPPEGVGQGNNEIIQMRAWGVVQCWENIHSSS